MQNVMMSLRHYSIGEQQIKGGISLEKARSIRVAVNRLQRENKFFKTSYDPIMETLTIKRVEETEWKIIRKVKKWN